jgi:Na+-driven multidrug efflux pump
VATLLLLAALSYGRRGVRIWSAHGWRPSVPEVRRILALGVPAAMEQALITLGFTAFTALMASQGTAVLAAQRIAFNALSLSFLPGVGFGIATTALVGMAVGGRRPDQGAAAAGVAARWAVIWMSAAGAIYLALADPILALFTSDAAVTAEGVPMMRLIALAQPAWALLFVYSGGLRGLGNTRYPLVTNTTGIWATVVVAYVLVDGLGQSAVTGWAGFALVSPLLAFLVRRRFGRSIASAPLPSRRAVNAAPTLVKAADG